MFQYAFAKSLSLRRNQELTLDCRYVNDRTWRPRFTFREYQLNKFGGEKFIFPSQQYFRGEIYIRIGWWRILKQLNNTLKKRVTRIRFECDPYTYDENLVNDHSGNSYHGYFQNPRYFDQFRNEILGEFQFRSNIPENAKPLKEAIQKSTSVCIHVRRGDYLKSDFGTLTLNYYKTAINILNSNFTKLQYFIFSDEPRWCAERFKNFPKTTIIGVNNDNFDPIVDLNLMSACQHFIIPNSTFSWWAAYLSENPLKKVIVPKGWHPELKSSVGIIHQSWFQLEDNNH